MESLVSLIVLHNPLPGKNRKFLTAHLLTTPRPAASSPSASSPTTSATPSAPVASATAMMVITPPAHTTSSPSTPLRLLRLLLVLRYLHNLIRHAKIFDLSHAKPN